MLELAIEENRVPDPIAVLEVVDAAPTVQVPKFIPEGEKRGQHRAGHAGGDLVLSVVDVEVQGGRISLDDDETSRE